MTKSSRLDFLDGLRGLAIFLVMWFHIWNVGFWSPPTINAFGIQLSLEFIPRTGFVGVELFFFVSGFALFVPHVRTMFDGVAPPTAQNFVWRRFIKIVPSYALVLFALILFGGYAFASAFDFVRVVAMHALFYLNELMVHPYGSINAALWSLSTEVQFYCAFPLIAIAFRRWPIPVYVLMSAGAIAFRVWLMRLPVHNVELLQVPAYLDLFSSGMLAAYLCEVVRRSAPTGRWFRTVSSVVAIAGSVLFVVLLESLWNTRNGSDWRDGWSIWGRYALAASFVIIAVGSSSASRWWRVVLANPLLVFLSVISYNLYLWHDFVALKLRGPWITDATRGLYTAIAAVIGIAIAAALTYFLERPLLKIAPPKWAISRRVQSASPGDTVAVAVGEGVTSGGTVG